MAEAKTAMSIVESALRAFAELTGGSARRRIPQVKHNTIVSIGDSPVGRELAALQQRMQGATSIEMTATAVTETTLEAPPPATTPEAPAAEEPPASSPRVLDFEEIPVGADALGAPFLERVTESDQLAALRASAMPDGEIYGDRHR